MKSLLLIACLLSVSLDVVTENAGWRELYAAARHARPAEAAQLLREMFSKDSETNGAVDGAAYFRLIQLYYKMGKTEQSKKVLEQFNSQKPKLSSEALVWLALSEASVYVAAQNAKDAKQQLESIRLDAPEITPEIKANYHLLVAQQKSIINLYDEAVSALNDANQWAQQTHDTHVLISALSLQVNIQYYMQQYQESLETNDQMLKLAEQYSDDFYRMFSYSHAMNIYYMLSTQQEVIEADAESKEVREAALAKKNEYIEKSDKYRSMILSKAESIGAFKPLLRAMIQIQNQHLRNEAFDKTVEYARETIVVADRYDSDYEKAVSLNNMSIAFRAMSKFDEAIAALNEADEVYVKLQHKQSMLWSLEDFSLIYEKKGDYKAALEYYKRLHNDSMELLRKTNSEKVLELQKVYESEKKQREIDRLKQNGLLSDSELKAQRIIITSIALLAVLIAIGFVFLYNRNKAIAAANAKLDELNARLKQQALRDPLTSLHNRRFIAEVQDKLVNAVMRRKNHDVHKAKIGLVLLDIDHFKKINDQYGHDVGDEVLVRVSSDLVNTLRGGDIAARWGGEEFLVVLLDTNVEGVRAFCERLLTLRNASVIPLGQTSGKVTMSMGYTLIPFADDASESLSWNESIKLVDKLLYIAKEHGRNQAVSIGFSRAKLPVETKQLMLSSEKTIDYDLLKQHGLTLNFLHPKTQT